MNARTLLVSAGLLVTVCGGAHSQPQIPPVSPFPTPNLPPTAPGTPPLPGTPVAPLPAPNLTPPAVTVPTPPPEKSVDDLIRELERIQAEKSALEKKEQELKESLRKKLDQQAERLKKLGVTPQPAKEKEPDRVARIIIEGNTKTPDEKILKQLEFVPGQILKYPALEEARARLAKAGFRDVTVEVVPNENEPDSHFKDVRVKVTEPRSER